MKTLTKKEIQAQEVLQAKENLKKLLIDGKLTVYSRILHVSQSGMSRRISFYVTTGAGELVNIDWYINKIGLYKMATKGGLNVGGCGMDMGFAVVYNLSREIFRGETDLEGNPMKDVGYVLTQKWM